MEAISDLEDDLRSDVMELLQENFDSVGELLDADKDDLTAIRNIGPSRAEKVLDTIEEHQSPEIEVGEIEEDVDEIHSEPELDDFLPDRYEQRYDPTADEYYKAEASDYDCPFCDKNVSSYPTLQTHVRRSHRDELPRSIR